MPIDYNFPPKGHRSAQGWYDRGHLPHFEGGAIPQFLTFRLYDSVPQSVIEQWKKDLTDIQFRKSVEKFLDAGYGSCFLKDPAVATIVADNLKFHDKKKYDLIAWVIMPNHVHYLVIPLEGIEVSTIAHSMKSYTAHEANKVLGRTGRFWQVEPFDRYIRNSKHYLAVIRYIENNPVKAGLCGKPGEWRFSSAYVEGCRRFSCSRYTFLSMGKRLTLLPQRCRRAACVPVRCFAALQASPVTAPSAKNRSPPLPREHRLTRRSLTHRDR